LSLIMSHHKLLSPSRICSFTSSPETLSPHARLHTTYIASTLRYIDDLYHVSTKTDDFIKITHDIYHSSLNLDRTIKVDTEAEFLNLVLSVENSALTLFPLTI